MSTTDLRLRRKLVEDLRRKEFLRDDRVAEAFEQVPRHLFVPGRPLKHVYSDEAIITKTLDGAGVSSSSQPSIMAIMLQQLELVPGQRVLEIGAGTGYNAALLAQLVRDGGHVTTIDIDPQTAEEAQAHLRAAGAGNVAVVAEDGGYGYAPHAPYDRIIATASCWQIPQPWIDQLAEGGVLVLPFRLNGAHVSLALRKDGRELVSTRAAMCGFMPLRGAFGPRRSYLMLPGVRVAAEVELSVSMGRSIQRLLEHERRVRLSFPRRRDALNTPLYFLALQGKPILNVLRSVDSWGLVPFALLSSPRSAVGLPWHRPPRGRLPLYGSEEALEFLRTALDRWVAEGKPDLRALRVRIRPTRARLGPLPRRGDGRYRLRRGEHLYTLWFER